MVHFSVKYVDKLETKWRENNNYVESVIEVLVHNLRFIILCYTYKQLSYRNLYARAFLVTRSIQEIEKLRAEQIEDKKRFAENERVMAQLGRQLGEQRSQSEMLLTAKAEIELKEMLHM